MVHLLSSCVYWLLKISTIVDVVAGAQIKAFGEQNFFMPNVIILNPKDATLMGLLKDGQENYIKAGKALAIPSSVIKFEIYADGILAIDSDNRENFSSFCFLFSWVIVCCF